MSAQNASDLSNLTMPELLAYRTAIEQKLAYISQKYQFSMGRFEEHADERRPYHGAYTLVQTEIDRRVEIFCTAVNQRQENKRQDIGAGA